MGSIRVKEITPDARLESTYHHHGMGVSYGCGCQFRGLHASRRRNAPGYRSAEPGGPRTGVAVAVSRAQGASGSYGLLVNS